jgi:hypothetical protein
MTFLSVAACHPDALDHLLDDVGLDPRSVTEDGQTVIYDLLAYEMTGDSAYSACTDEVLVRSIRTLLEAGADPCVAPTDEPTDVPVIRAAEWGAAPQIVELLREFGRSCLSAIAD